MRLEMWLEEKETSITDFVFNFDNLYIWVFLLTKWFHSQIITTESTLWSSTKK